MQFRFIVKNKNSNEWEWNIDRADMARWTILCAERYLSIFYDYLHEKLYEYHVLQADETPVLVSKEDRTTGTKVNAP
ncbi:MAG: IS66 family transposase [Coprococcus phoceensis]